MKLICTNHAKLRLIERFGVRWTVGLEMDLCQQLAGAPGPLGTAELRARGEPPGTSYWAVRVGGAAAVLVLSDRAVITTVLRQLIMPDEPKRPKRPKRRAHKHPISKSGPRPRIEYTEDE